MRHPVVLVEWGDAFIDTEDFDPKKALKAQPVVRTTVGFFIGQNANGDIILATDFYAKKKDGAAALMFIPMGMVRDWYELEIL